MGYRQRDRSYQRAPRFVNTFVIPYLVSVISYEDTGDNLRCARKGTFMVAFANQSGAFPNLCGATPNLLATKQSSSPAGYRACISRSGFHQKRFIPAATAHDRSRWLRQNGVSFAYPIYSVVVYSVVGFRLFNCDCHVRVAGAVLLDERSTF